MFIEVNGIKLYYEKRGAGRPLLLLHGNGEDHGIFLQAMLLLEKRFCCYALDTRCHGQSGAGPLHYADMAGDVLGFLEALDLRDAVLCGFSDGGITGLLAAAQTERVTTLIVCGANLTPGGVKWPARLLMRVQYRWTKDPKLALMLSEPEISDDMLAKIRACTLVLAGSRDLIPEKESRHIAEAIPGSELCILPGEDHGSYVVHRDKIAKLIAEYCRSTG